MQKRISIPLFFVGFFLISFAQAQVKIGDNPQTIDPASILELESSDKVLVITRVDSLQMTTIVPNRGALVYNTTADCVYYYDGAAWISMCEGADGGALTATPIVNSQSTIVLTPTAGGNNVEIAPNSITSDQILNGGINGVDIQNGSIGRGKLAPNAVDKARIAQNAVGPYAIDRDSLPLSFFNNDAGFITGANVVSGDADNSISVGSDSGAFFDATTLEDNIAANTAAIAADGDKNNTNEIQTLSISGNLLSITNGNAVTIPTADGSDTNINEGNNITITGNGTAATPYVINAANEVDGSITNELITGAVLNAANELVITEAGTNTTVDLSSLAGGGGTADGVVTAVNFDNATDILTFTGTGGGFNGSVDLSDLAGGGTGATPDLGEVLTESNDADGSKITNLGVPTLDQDAATKKYVDDVVAAGGDLANGTILIGDATDSPVAQTISGDATIDNAGELTIADDVIESANILDGTIELADLGQNSAADGDVIRWDDDTTSWIVEAAPGEHTGTPKAIFFADTDGTPTTADDNSNINDDGGFIWDTNARPVGGQTYGALLVGKQAGSPTLGAHAKVVITERIANGHPTQSGLAYPLQIQNENDTSTGEAATGILFAVDRNEDYGKGALAYERLGNSGQGDFHFLQEPNTGDAIPTLANKAFTVKNNGDIVLYNGIEIAGDRGDANQVLTSNGAGAVSWENAGQLSITDADANDALVVQTDGKGYNIGVDDTTIEIISDALQVKDASINSAKITNGTIALEDLSNMGATANGEVLKWDQDNSVWKIGTDDTSSGISAVAATTSFTGDGTSGSELDIADNVITTNELAVNAVFEENINANAVTSAKIAANTIALDDLSNMGATTTGQILKWDQATTQWTIGTDNGGSTAYTAGTGLTLSGANEFSVNALAGEVTGPTTATVIADDVIGTEELAVNAVFTENINAGAVTFEKIGQNEVRPENIQESANANEVLTTNTSGDVVWAPVSGTNLSTTNLTQTTGEDRTYNLNGSNLYFDGAGLIGIGTTTPAAKFHVSGGQVRAATFSAGDGFAYGFSSDPDTGMYREEADKIAFDVGGNQALTIDEPRTGITNVTVNGAFSTNIRTEPSGGVVNIAEDDYTVIISNATSVTLPTPSTSGTDINIGKIYILKNTTGGLVTISSFSDSFGNNVTDLQSGVTQLQSDGTTWHQIN